MATEQLTSFLDSDLPFCPGCGHHSVAKNMERALQQLGLSPLDVVVVTDIGCIGIIDKSLYTHTVHGLHGRSIALGMGVALGMSDRRKKVVVLIGDGGATIGMQHLLDAAHRNVDLTVLLCNNMLYGMTGGQPSGLTPKTFRTAIYPEGQPEHGYDFCRLTAEAGASFVVRCSANDDFAPHIAKALDIPGFALIEILEMCTSYTPKYNKGLRIKTFAEQSGIASAVFKDEDLPGFVWARRQTDSLLDSVKPIEPLATSSLDRPYSIVLSGSAGEGIQSAAELFCQAAIASGLQASKKGSYPVTVGVGFSSADVIISPRPIYYSGSEEPDALILTSEDGVGYNKPRLSTLRKTKIWCDSSLSLPEVKAPCERLPLREKFGAKSAALGALATLIASTGLLPKESFLAALERFDKRIDKEQFAALFG